MATKYHSKRNSMDSQKNSMPNLSGLQEVNLASSQNVLPRRMAASPSAMSPIEDVRISRPSALAASGALNPYVDNRAMYANVAGEKFLAT